MSRQKGKHILMVLLLMFIFASLALFSSPQQPFSTLGQIKNSSNLPRRVIWVFWDKAPIPAFIRLSLATVICHTRGDNIHVQLINESHLPQWIDNIHPAFEHLIPAHKGDYFRARILDTYGGMYIDADTIGFGSVKHLFDKLNTYDLVNIDYVPDRDSLAIQVIGPTKAHSIFTRRWVSGVHELLDNKLEALKAHSKNNHLPYPIGWTEMLRGVALPILDKILNQTKFQYFRFSGHKTFMQLVFTRNFYPFNNFTGRNLSFNETEMLEFYDSSIEHSFREISVDDLLHGHYLFSSLVRYSMNECREGRSHLKRNKTITVDDNTARNGDLIQWIESFMAVNNL